MSEVTLSIGGRTYKVACAEGEEQHVRKLGEEIDAKLQSMGQRGSHDAQNLLFGALLLADDLAEARGAVSAAQDERDEAQKSTDKLKAEIEPLRAERDELRAKLQAAEAQLPELRRKEEETASAFAELKAELATLKSEMESSRDAERQMSEELAELKEERDAIQAELEEARSTPAIATLADDPDLAPALERFAGLLEKCADKLETASVPS